MHDVDLNLLTADRLAEASTWVSDLVAVPGAVARDVDDLVLSGVGLSPEELTTWACLQAPPIVHSVLLANASRVVPLETALQVVAVSAVSFGAVVTLKGLQDSNEVVSGG